MQRRGTRQKETKSEFQRIKSNSPIGPLQTQQHQQRHHCPGVNALQRLKHKKETRNQFNYVQFLHDFISCGGGKEEDEDDTREWNCDKVIFRKIESAVINKTGNNNSTSRHFFISVKEVHKNKLSPNSRFSSKSWLSSRNHCCLISVTDFLKIHSANELSILEIKAMKKKNTTTTSNNSLTFPEVKWEIALQNHCASSAQTCTNCCLNWVPSHDANYSEYSRTNELGKC